jgi:hypothetical protein
MRKVALEAILVADLLFDIRLLLRQLDLRTSRNRRICRSLALMTASRLSRGPLR